MKKCANYRLRSVQTEKIQIKCVQIKYISILSRKHTPVIKDKSQLKCHKCDRTGLKRAFSQQKQYIGNTNPPILLTLIIYSRYVVVFYESVVI